VILYLADASWHNHGRRGGRRYHVPSEADAALAACSRRIVLCPDGSEHDKVPENLLCGRPACRTRIDAAREPT